MTAVTRYPSSLDAYHRYVRLTCALTTLLRAEAIHALLLDNSDIAGWFDIAKGDATPVQLVTWTINEPLFCADGASSLNEAELKARLSSMLDAAARAAECVANETAVLLAALRSSLPDATVEWDVAPPVPPALARTLPLPLRVDRHRREDAATIIDGEGAELVHVFGDSGELGEILWRANLHPHLADAVETMRARLRSLGPAWDASPDGARVSHVLSLLHHHG